jgi:hypothetical protein
MDAIDKGDWSLLEQFAGKPMADTAKTDIANATKEYPNYTTSHALHAYSAEFRETSESFATQFNDYILGGTQIPSYIRDFWENNFPKQLTQVKIPPERAAILRSMCDNWDSQIAELPEVLSAVKKARADAVGKVISWDESNALVEEAWNSYRSKVKPIIEQNRILLDRLSGLAPVTPPPIANELLPIHVAALFRTTGDDLAKGLFKVETQTLMPKQEFIDIVRRQ